MVFPPKCGPLTDGSETVQNRLDVVLVERVTQNADSGKNNSVEDAVDETLLVREDGMSTVSLLTRLAWAPS